MVSAWFDSTLDTMYNFVQLLKFIIMLQFTVNTANNTQGTINAYPTEKFWRLPQGFTPKDEKVLRKQLNKYKVPTVGVVNCTEKVPFIITKEGEKTPLELV